MAGTATTFTDYTAVSTNTYTYSVTASDAAGLTSVASNSVGATPPLPTDTTKPAAPTNLAANVRSSGEIDLTWTASSDNVAVSGYRVYRDGVLVTNSTPQNAVGGTSFADVGLAAHSSHTYQISAIDAAGNESTLSNSITKVTMYTGLAADTGAPTTPGSLGVVTSASNSVSLSWTSSSDNVAVVGYRLSRNGSTVPTFLPASATTYSDLTVSPSSVYTYSLVALDAAGNASTPAVTSAQTPVAAPPPDTSAPTAPGALTATTKPGEADLAWTASTDNVAVAGYTVSRDGVVIDRTYTPAYADTAATVGTHTYSVTAFDAAGNVSDPASVANVAVAPALLSISYTYDLADRLTAITSASGSTTSFTIDALGRHGSQTIGSTTSSYAYLGSSDVVVAVTSASSTTTSAVDGLGDRVASAAGGTFGFFVSDLHGNVAGALDASASSFTDAFAYDAYGDTVASLTSSLPTPWRYQGRMLESGAGAPALYDFAARSYAPSLGIFTSLDTLGGSATNPALLNGYLYADANPATLVDPDGHSARVMYDEGPVHHGRLVPGSTSGTKTIRSMRRRAGDLMGDDSGPVVPSPVTGLTTVPTGCVQHVQIGQRAGQCPAGPKLEIPPSSSGCSPRRPSTSRFRRTNSTAPETCICPGRGYRWTRTRATRQ